MIKAGTKFDDIPNLRLFEKAINSLEKREVDTNIFIDGNHIKLAIDALVSQSQHLHNEMFKHFDLGDCPALKINEEVYSEFIHQIILSVEWKLFTAYREFSKKYNAVDVLRGSEALSCAMHEIKKTGKLFSEEDNLFENSEYAKKEGWDKKRPQVLGFNNYVNFFVGGEYNSDKLLKDLKYRLRISSDKYEQSRLHEFIKAFSGEETGSLETKMRQLEDSRYEIFKSALKNFDKKWPKLVAETHKGYLKHTINERSKILVTFREKAVDTRLIIKAVDDLNDATDNTIFAIFTNDTDFAPLFEKIMSKCQLLWVYGGDPKFASSDLKKIVPETNRFNIFELILGEKFEDYGYSKFFQPTWWADNQLAPVISGGIAKLTDLYMEYEKLLSYQYMDKEYDAYQKDFYANYDPGGK